MSATNGHAQTSRSPGHECEELCGGPGKRCKCPPCSCPAHLERTGRTQLHRPELRDVPPRPDPPRTLF